MSKKAKQIAKSMIIFESLIGIIIMLSFFWLNSVLVGLFFILFIAIIATWAIGLIYSIILLKGSKRRIIQERIDAVEIDGSNTPGNPPFRLENWEEEL